MPERVQVNRASSRASIQNTDAEDFSCLLRVGGEAKRKERGAKRNAEDTLADY
jgi:hypothetical protein